MFGSIVSIPILIGATYFLSSHTQNRALEAVIVDVGDDVRARNALVRIFDIQAPYRMRDWVIFDGASLADNDLRDMLDPLRGAPPYASRGYNAFLRIPTIKRGRPVLVWYHSYLAICGTVLCPYDQQDLKEISEPSVADQGSSALRKLEYVDKLGFRFPIIHTLYVGKDGTLVEYEVIIADPPVNALERFFRPASGAVRPDFLVAAATYFVNFRSMTCLISRPANKWQPFSC